MNGFFFEIITKREITKHFKKRVMACGVADILKVIMLTARTDAFLRRNSSGIIALFKTCENILKLHHTRIGKHQSGIILWHKRA